MRIVERLEPVLGSHFLVRLGVARARALLRLVEIDERLVLQVAQGDELSVAGELSLEPHHAEAFLKALKATPRQ